MANAMLMEANRLASMPSGCGFLGSKLHCFILSNH
jgi:hypothetical protein